MRRSLFQRILDIPKMIWIALRFNLSPPNYNYYLLPSEPLTTDRLSRFLSGWEFNFLGRRIARLRQSDVSFLDNKDKFLVFCETHDLPTPATFNLRQKNAQSIELSDLFVKSTQGYGGRDCLLLPHAEGQDGWLFEDRVVSSEELQPLLDAQFGRDHYILQYRLRNHPSMLWLSDHVLTTVRALTAWSPSGEAVILRATLRLPGQENSFLDNSDQGGWAAPLDPLTGSISGPATNWIDDQDIEYPLSSSRSILDYTIPLWEEARALLLRAHQAADNFNFLGWDIAFTDKGVQLVECNVWSDIDLVQIPQKKPLLTDDVLACFMAEPSLQPDFHSGPQD